jgi:hypothetical protein
MADGRFELVTTGNAVEVLLADGIDVVLRASFDIELFPRDHTFEIVDVCDKSDMTLFLCRSTPTKRNNVFQVVFVLLLFAFSNSILLSVSCSLSLTHYLSSNKK